MNYNIWRGVRELCIGYLWETDMGTGQSVPEITTSLAEVLNDDYTQFRITLRDDLLWSDGQPFSADDVIYTLDTYFAEKEKLTYWGVNTITNYVADYAKTDDCTIEIETINPAYDFHTVLGVQTWGSGFNIVPKHIYEQQEDISQFRNTYPVCLGPYTLSEFDPNGFWALWELREDYANSAWGWQGEPKAKYVLYKDFGTEEKRVLAFTQNLYDVDTFMSPDSIKAAQDFSEHIETWNPQVPYHNMDDACQYGILINNIKAPYDIKEVRWALALALDMKSVGINALDDVTLHLESDEPVIISLVGESGSGKTTLAKVLLRLVEPDSGNASIYERVVAGEAVPKDKTSFLRGVQPIFQNPFEAFSSYRTVDAYLQTTAERVGQLSRSETLEVMTDALNAVGLKYADVKGKYPNQFSGGELQRVSVARALIPRPKMIIADEPVSMIDASMRMNVVNLFLKIKDTYKSSFLYITHDLATAYYISDYVAVMYRGCIVEFGAAVDVLTSPAHPYTQLLLDSIASLTKKWDGGGFKVSEMESKEFQFKGCKFYNRCPIAEEKCIHERPAAKITQDGREVYCHFA